MRRSCLGPLGFLTLMLGFGLQLESGWTRLGALLLGAGAMASAFGLLATADPGAAGPPDDVPTPFTRDDGGR